MNIKTLNTDLSAVEVFPSAPIGGEPPIIEASAKQPNASEATEIQACTQTEATKDKKGSQASPGDLKRKGDLLKYAMLGYKTVKVKIEDIQHFELIPDYSLPTTAVMPIVVVSPKGTFCIEGWDIVAEAQDKKCSSIPCEVEIMAEHFDQELCLRKAAIRAITRGGDAAYMEICRNTAITLEQLRASSENLVFFSHGGRRVKDDLKDDQIDALHILAVRLGRDRDTISGHLSHVEWLSQAAMQVFIEQDAGKRFFDKTKTIKKNLLRELERDGKSPEEIFELISALMLKEWKKFNEKETASPATETVPAEASPEADPTAMPTEGELNDMDDAEDLDDTADESLEADRIESEEPEALSITYVKRTVKEVSERLLSKVNDEVSLEELEACITAEMNVFLQMLSEIAHLKNIQASR